MAERRSHYVYKVFNRSTGEYYIGKRSCRGLPLDDSYMGSGVVISAKVKKHPEMWEKSILMECESEEAAYAQEALAVGDLWETDPLCLNLKSGGVGMTSDGMQRVWQQHRDKIIEGQQRVPHVERVRRGTRSQELHGERIVANLNRWARSEEGRRVVAQSKIDAWADPEYRAKSCAAMKESRSKSEYKQRRRQPVRMVHNGQVIEVTRDKVCGLLQDGASFKNQYIHLHNTTLGIWTEGVVGWKAIKIYLTNQGWEYGKNRSLRRVSITNINLETGRENNG